MILLWANLLASSAMSERSNVPYYVSILSNINGQQARLIQDIMTMRGKLKSKLDGDILLDNLWSVDQAGVLLKLRQEVEAKNEGRPKHDWKNLSVTQINKTVRLHVDQCGVVVSDIILNKGEEQWDSKKGLFPVGEHQTDIEILGSLGLLKDVTFKDVPFGGYELSVFLYQVTRLCVDMFAACNPDIIGRREESEPKTRHRRISN